MKRAKDIDISKIDTSSPEFDNALKLLQYTTQSVFLTGKAGTGKSTFLQYLTATTKKKFVVLAPTGIAAVNAGGQTIHSFFKLPFKPMLPDDPDADGNRLKKRLAYSRQHVKLLRKLELIIIDEVSMVRADTIDLIDKILRMYSNNHRMPFGGKQLLLLGDVFQLEPVITGDIRDVLGYFYKDGAYFFNARAFDGLSVVPIELTRVYRQRDPAFISMLDRIRVGAPLQSDIDLLNAKVQNTISFSDDFTMTIATRRDIVDSINDTRLAGINRPERRFTGEISGDFPDNSLPTDRELVIKDGAQVVFVKNDPDRRWVNGTIGRVVDISDEGIAVELENGTRHTVEEAVWDNVKYEYDEERKSVKEIVTGSYKQFPIKLAWAITIHKSQGLTFDKVTIDLGQGAFSSGQTYVALSRCRSLEGITMRSTINPRDVFVNNRIVRFSRTFNNPALISGALENARADDCYHRAAKAFDRGEYGVAARLFAEAVCSRNDLGREDVTRLLGMKLQSLASIATEVKELKRQIGLDRRKFLKLAVEYVDMGEDVREGGWDIKAALANYDKAIDLCPDYYMAWLCKGLALADISEFDAAMECFAEAARLDTKDYRALYEGGRMSVHNGDLAEGMDMLLRALERNGECADIHIALAEGYEKVDDRANADIHRKKARELGKKRKNQKK